MKKKGFTLIELLGVIIVLAIIALIAVPTILGVIDKARKAALKDSAYGLIEAANLYYAQYGVSNTERFNLEEENELKYKGKVEIGTVLLNSKGKVMICINDNGNAAYKNYNDNEVIVISGKTCNVNTSETQILLDGEKTIDEYTNQELTDLVNSLQKQIDELKNDKTDNTRTDEVEEVVSTKADTTLVTNLSSQLSSLSGTVNNHTTHISDINSKLSSIHTIRDSNYSLNDTGWGINRLYYDKDGNRIYYFNPHFNGNGTADVHLGADKGALFLNGQHFNYHTSGIDDVTFYYNDEYDAFQLIIEASSGDNAIMTFDKTSIKFTLNDTLMWSK